MRVEINHHNNGLLKFLGREEQERKAPDSVQIELQNKNLLVTGQEKTLAIVPDLITILDSETGSAVGTQDYRYGLHVSIIVLVASAQWSEEEGLKIGGPAAFQLEDVYITVAQYKAVQSVIFGYGQ